MKHYHFYLRIVLIAILAACFTLGNARASASNIVYVVQPGDTLNIIAEKYCTTWRAIYNLNSDVIGSNPNLIYSGMKLTVPANCTPGTKPPAKGVYDRGPAPHANGTFKAPYYTVARGDWLYAIGQRFGVPWREIADANDISGTTIYRGQLLLIPGTKGTTPPSQSTAERVRFITGKISASREGTISNGKPKTYVLRALAGQDLYVTGSSDAEALTVSVKTAQGKTLKVYGKNGRVNFDVEVYLPVTGDYYVTFTPVNDPDVSKFAFDVKFTIPALP